MASRRLHIATALFLLAGVASLPAQGYPPQSASRIGDRTNQVEATLQRMTLEQKLGQMLIVQFVGPSYSSEIAAMVRTYGVGGVIFYARNGNIKSADQLRGIIGQLQRASAVPLWVAIDQEGGYVDRLVQLNGRRPSAASIAETDDPAIARAVGVQDARDLSELGFNLNLAPVVDVGRVSNPQLTDRTFGDDPQSVTRLAGAYLDGLQESGKVLGVLKHFPGLGGVRIDPHQDMPVLTQTREQLEAVDWVPYRSMIGSRSAHAVMVTHEMVRSLDPSVRSIRLRRQRYPAGC